MPRSGKSTRDRIIACTEALVYRHGFTATTVDRVIDCAGITKGAFFYHFKTKADLGRALIENHAARDLAHLDGVLQKVGEQSTDPNRRLMAFLDHLADYYSKLGIPVDGCLFTSYLYERAEYPEDVAGIARRTFEIWTDRVGSLIDEALKASGRAAAADGRMLASSLLATIEGALVLAMAADDGGIVVDLIGQFKAQCAALTGAPG